MTCFVKMIEFLLLLLEKNIGTARSFRVVAVAVAVAVVAALVASLVVKDVGDGLASIICRSYECET
jgi:hypothetical protein